MEEKKLVPKLRFPGFTEPWEQRKLGEIVERVTRKNNGQSDRPLTISAQDGLVDQCAYFDRQVASRDMSNYYLIKKGEFAYNKSYSDGYPFGATKRLDYYDKGALSTLYIIFKIVDDRIDSDFMVAYYMTSLWHKEISKRAAEGARNHGLLNISTEDFFNSELKIPNDIKEQIKVGKFINQFDQYITLHQRKLEHLKLKKKSLLQKLFPKEGEVYPELRFPGFTDPWEQRKLGDIATITGGGTPSTNISEYWNGDIDWYSPVEIGEKRYASGSIRKITKLGLEKSSAKILPVGTVLFTSRAGIGNTAILQVEGCTNQGFQSITPNSKELDTYFLYTMTPKLKRYGEVTGAGSTFVEVSGKQMEQMNLMIPSLDEQKHVSQLFKVMDDAITLHQRKLEHLQLLKKALLQQLFV